MVIQTLSDQQLSAKYVQLQPLWRLQFITLIPWKQNTRISMFKLPNPAEE